MTRVAASVTLTTPVIAAGSPTAAGALGYAAGTLNVGDGAVSRNVVTFDNVQTLTNKSLTSPVLTGTITGSPTYTGTIHAASGVLDNFSLTAATLSSPSITGTVAGGASYTAPTITSPTISGTVAGGATYTSPTIKDVIGVPLCRARRTTTQTISNNTFTAVGLDAEYTDTDTMHDNVTNNSRITATTAGTYSIFGAVSFVANATGSRFVGIRLNGGNIFGEVLVPNAGTDATRLTTTCLMPMAANDYVELVVWQLSGGNLDLEVAAPSYSLFSAVRVGQNA